MNKIKLNYFLPIVATLVNFNVIYVLISSLLLPISKVISLEEPIVLLISIFLSYPLTILMFQKVILKGKTQTIKEMIGKYNKDYLKLAFLVGFLLFIFQQITVSFVPTNPGENAENVNYITQQGVFFTLFATIVLAPIFEEIFFRGFFNSLLRDAPEWVYYLNTSIVFGLLHWGNANNLPFAIYNVTYISFLGFLMGYFYKKTNWLGSTIIAHSTFNAISMGLYYLALSLM